MVRIGSAFFNADHTRLGDELRRTEAAGVDFFHFDVFDGYFVPDQAFPARTIKALRPLTTLPFEVHLAANDPMRFLGPLAEAGVELVYLPAESTPLLYEAIYALREKGLRAGLCLALACDIRILASGAKFAPTPVKRGIVPESGGTGILPRLGGWEKAAEIFFAARNLDAEQSKALGLCSHVVPDAELMTTARALAAEIAANAPLAVKQWMTPG